MLLAGVVVSLVTLVVGIVAVMREPGILLNGRVAITYIVSAVAVLVPLWAVLPAVGKPAIHDITTDTEDPPEFEAVVPLRAGSPNSVEYAGAELARAQQAAYPDLTPLVVNRPASWVFDQIGTVAEELGWEVVAVDAAQGRLEATDTTFWFGFKDDIVVRIRDASDGYTRLDVRSTSRVGVGDLGVNAERIQEFFSLLQSHN